MTEEYRCSLTELNTILGYMNLEYVLKLPNPILDFITSNMNTNYIPNISKDVPIDKQNIKRTTKILLSILYREYWCDEKTNRELLEQEKYEKIIFEQEQIGPEILFNINEERETTEVDIDNKMQIIESNIFKRIISRIKKMFKK